jgi:dihydropteroate synthase
MAAHALGISLGCRVIRAHDVRGTKKIAAVLAAIHHEHRERLR